jgi:hypothetical protein
MLVVSLMFIAIGYATDLPVFGVIGFFLIFIAGVMVFSGELEYKVGETVNVTNISDVTSYASTNQYEAVIGTRAHLFGVLLSVIGGIGIMLVYTTKDMEGYHPK